ncbi:MAG: YheC/YheD family protein [Alicyclobacillus sp.]|nr:YheC/YheD family protein [Alicyclobacillus sp.]
MLVAVTGSLLHPSDPARRLLAFRTLCQAGARFGLPVLITTPACSGRLSGRVRGCSVSADGAVREVVERVRPSGIVVHDAMYLAELNEHGTPYRALMRRLAAAEVPRFNPVLPGKDEVYRCLEGMSAKGTRYTAACLPATWYGLDVGRVLQLAREHSAIWLKPVRGSGGRNILCIQRAPAGPGGSRQWRVAGERYAGRKLCVTVDERELAGLLSRVLSRRPYVAQQHVPLPETADGRRLDFRVTIARGETGEWRVCGITGRLGRPGSVLTNYHAGGEAFSLTRVLCGAAGGSAAGSGLASRVFRAANSRQEARWPAEAPQAAWDPATLAAIADAAVQAARHLEERWPTLGVLGVDVGLTADGRRFVYDCNGRPGRDILTDGEIETLMGNVAGFARYLFDRRRGREGRAESPPDFTGGA